MMWANFEKEIYVRHGSYIFTYDMFSLIFMIKGATRGVKGAEAPIP